FGVGGEANFHVGRDAALHDAGEDDSAAIRIEPGIENQSAQRRIGGPFGRRDEANDRFENIFDAQAGFGADGQSIVGGNGEDAFDLLLGEIDAGGGKIDLVDDRNNFETVFGGEKSVGDGLGFDAL